jgi:hypothetical protein
LNLQSEVEGEQSEIVHLELQYHLHLEPHDLVWSCPRDDEIINIYPDDELATISCHVVDVVLALMKPELAQGVVKLFIPCPWSLTPTVEGSSVSQHLMFFSGDDEPLWLPNVHFFRKFIVEEG